MSEKLRCFSLILWISLGLLLLTELRLDSLDFVGFGGFAEKSSYTNSICIATPMEIEFNGLDLSLQNRVSCTRVVSFLNSFENVLPNKIVCKLVLF